MNPARRADPNHSLPSSSRTESPVESRGHRWWWLLLIVLTLVTRLPSILHPRAIDDESITAVIALEIVDGGKPYINGIERKPPFLFWAAALVFWLFGKQNWVALHLTSALWVLLTMYGLYRVGRELFDRTTGLVAATLYGIYQPWAYWKNLAFNGELAMNLPIAWAMLLAFRRTESRRRPELLLAGALLCVAFLFKQPAAAAALPLGIYLLLPSYRASRGLSFRNSLAQATLLTLGFFGTLGAAVAFFYHHGIFDEALRWSILDHDVPHGLGDPVFWMRALPISLAFVASCAPLIIGSVLSIVGRWDQAQSPWREKDAEYAAMIGLLIASLVGTSASGRFYPHYLIQLVLPLSLFAAAPYAGILSGGSRHRSWFLRRRTTIAWLALTVAALFVSHVIGLAAGRAETDAGRYIREHSTPDDRVFVWGQGISPAIYLDAHRRPSSRFVTTFALTGYIFGSPLSWDPNHDTSDRILPGAWDTLQEEFRAHPPRFIVDTDGARATPKYPVARFPVLHRLLVEEFEEVYRAREGIIYRRRDTSDLRSPPPSGDRVPVSAARPEGALA